MKKILNTLFYILKFFLLIASFAITLFIILAMYQRLGKSITESGKVFLPFLLVFIIFCINLFAKTKGVSNNLFYNLTCCMVLIVVIVVGIRAVYDKNMVLNQIMGYNINFSYFSDFIPYMQLMMYGLVVSNLFLIVTKKEVKDNSVNENPIISETKPLVSKIENPIQKNIETKSSENIEELI